MKKLLMALVLLPLMAAADGNFTWITESNGAGTVSIVGIDGCPKGVIRIPSIVDGKTVTELGYRLFADRENIAEVVIPDTVVRIGASMFSESSVERVTLPHTLEEIACGDEQLYLRWTPNGYSYAPGDWKTAGGWGIFNADRLKSLSFSGGRASNDAGTYYIQDGMLFHRLTLDATAQGVPLEYRTVVNLLGITGSGRHGKLTIPDGVNGIVANAFEDLEGVTELSLPSSLVALGGGYGGGCAFGWMASLSRIVVRSSGSPYKVIGNSLVDTRTRTLVVSTANTVIPADGSITKISRWAFSAAPEKVVIPDCVTDIAPSAFCCANFIRRIEVGAGAVNIMGGAFANIGGLDELVISERNPKYEVVNDCVVEKTELRSMITTAAHPKHYKCLYQGLTYYEFDCHVPYFCRGIVDSAFKDERFVRTVILPKEMQYVPMIDYYNETVASYSDVRRVEIADCSSRIEMEASRTYQELNDQFWDHTEEFEGFYWTEDPQVAVRAIGRVVADGFGRYAPGATVTLTANAIDAGCSVRWRDANGKCVGTRADFSFTMPSDDVLYSVESVSVAEGAYNWDVSENDDGTVTIRGVIGAEPMGVLTIPATYGGKLVKQVGEEERYDHERGVFAGCGIASLVIEDGVEVLGYGAFNGCKSLASVKLPSSLKTIRENCFEGCSALKSIDLPEGLQKVEFDFLNDTAVSTLNIPSTLVDIGDGALACRNFRKFTVAEGNPRYRVENGYIYDYVDNIAFMRTDYYQKTFVISDGAVRIAECCFGDCDGGNITIPASVRRIDYSVFGECKGLTVTFLGEEPHVSKKDGGIFDGSTNVKVYVQPGQGWDDVVRRGTWQGVPVAYAPGAVTYRTEPNYRDGGITLTGIASGTPSGTLYIPSTYNGQTVTAVGGNFYQLGGITKVVFPLTVKRIVDCGFEDCPNLQEIVLNEGLEEIGGWAFNDCDKIKKIVIPSTVRSIGDSSFNINGLESIEVAGGNDWYYAENGFLIEKAAHRTITCVSVRDGRGVSLAVPQGVFVIGRDTFRKSKCTALSFPSSVREIETLGVLAPDSTIREIDLSMCENLTSIGAGGFMAAQQLAEVRFPESLLNIGRFAFGGCAALQKVTFLGRRVSIPEELNEELEEYLKTLASGAINPERGGDLYVARDGKLLSSVTTYILPEMGWENEICAGAWQGRPIRFVGESPLDAEYRFVPGEQVDIDSTLIGYTAKGLPSGLKYNKKTGKITGAAKKPTAAEGVTVKFTKRNEPDAEIQIVVGPMPKLSIALEGDTEKCKAKGAGAYLVGKKVSLSATAPKGTAFTGWFANGAPWPNEADCRKAKLSYVMTRADVSLVAKFEKERMSVGCAGLEGRGFTVGVSSGAGIPLEIETQSGVKSVKVSKLPAGMKYNAKTGLIEGAPTKAGDFTVQIAVTAKSGAMEKKDIAIRVDPLPDWAVGTFSGMIGRRLGLSGEDGAAFYGSLQFTVKATGAVAAKVMAGGKTYSFSAKGFRGVEDGEAFLSHVNYPDADEVACRVSDTLVLDLETKKGDALLLGVTLFQKSGHLCVAKVGGTFVRSGCDSPYGLVAWRNEAGKDSRIAPGSPAEEAVARLKNLGKVYLKARELEPRADGARHFSLNWLGGEPLHRYGSKEADFTLSVDKSGNVKVSGKIDGVKLTASTPLRFSGNEWFSVSADSIAYDKKSGMDYEFILGWDTIDPHTGAIFVTPDPNADPLTAGPDMHGFELWIEPFE